MVIKNIVLSGGGPSILVPLGAIQQLEINNFWKINDIENIYATSAGTILATLISLKIKWIYINDYIIERPWNNIFNISSEDILNIYNDKGLLNKKVIENFFKPFFDLKDISLNITLLEFYNYTNINLYFFTFEINSFQTIKLHHSTHPNFKLIESIYMSCSIPLIFKPICINETCYIDGGIIVNYPLNYCLDDGHPCDEIISFKNKYIEDVSKTINEKTQTLEYITILLNKIIRNMNTENNQNKINNEIICETKELSLTFIIEFINSIELRKSLITNGIEIANEFLNSINSEK